MRYLILFIILFLSFQSAFAEDQPYRIELLILRNLDGVSTVSPQTTLRDFSKSLDLSDQAPVTAEEQEPGSEEPSPATAEPAQTGTEPSVEGADPGVEAMNLMPKVVLLQTQSETMQQAWKRLRASAGYRPELYLSWQQPDDESFPLIRVHDTEVLLEIDPYADLRANAEFNGQKAVPTFADGKTTSSGMAQTNVVNDGSIGATVELPEPTRFYRIDGTASLRKTRFLHLDLDIEYREPVFGGNTQESPYPPANLQGKEKPRPSAYLVHTLRQSRQVQTDEMEYFDGPVFAVLALVTRVTEPADQDTQAKQTAE